MVNLSTPRKRKSVNDQRLIELEKCFYIY